MYQKIDVVDEERYDIGLKVSKNGKEVRHVHNEWEDSEMFLTLMGTAPSMWGQGHCRKDLKTTQHCPLVAALSTPRHKRILFMRPAPLLQIEK